MTPLTLLILFIIDIDILNIKQLSHLILVLKLLTGNSLLRRVIPQINPLKVKSFLPFNFAITEICVAVHLAEDGTRMGGI